jgi:hypothetical protein
VFTAEGLPVHIGSTQHLGTAGTAQLVAGITQQPFKLTIGELNSARRIYSENGISALCKYLT